MNTSEVQLKLLGQCSHEFPGDDAGGLRLHIGDNATTALYTQRRKKSSSRESRWQLIARTTLKVKRGLETSTHTQGGAPLAFVNLGVFHELPSHC